MDNNSFQNYKYQCKLFLSISNHFIGCNTLLFSYSPGFQELYILTEIEQKSFLLKFMFTKYAKIKAKFNFIGTDCRSIINDNNVVLFSKQKSFRIVASFFGIYHMYNHHYTNDDDKGKCNLKKNSVAIESLSQKANILLGFSEKTVACVYRYDRWNKKLFLEIDDEFKKESLYLVLFDCVELEFYPEQNFKLSRTKLYKDNQTIVFEEIDHKFSANFGYYEMWNQEKFFEYDMNLYSLYGLEKGSGTKELVRSVEDFENILLSEK